MMKPSSPLTIPKVLHYYLQLQSPHSFVKVSKSVVLLLYYTTVIILIHIFMLPVVQRPNVLQAHPLQLQQGITATIFQNSLTTPEVRPYPEPPRFTTLMNELINRVAAKWEEIGFSLRLESGLLEIIKKDNPSDCRACLREMLKEWMKQVDPPPSWSAIIKAVKDCGYRPLARTLKEKYLLSTGYATLS